MSTNPNDTPWISTRQGRRWNNSTLNQGRRRNRQRAPSPESDISTQPPSPVFGGEEAEGFPEELQDQNNVQNRREQARVADVEPADDLSDASTVANGPEDDVDPWAGRPVREVDENEYFAANNPRGQRMRRPRWGDDLENYAPGTPEYTRAWARLERARSNRRMRRRHPYGNTRNLRNLRRMR